MRTDRERNNTYYRRRIPHEQETVGKNITAILTAVSLGVSLGACGSGEELSVGGSGASVFLSGLNRRLAALWKRGIRESALKAFRQITGREPDLRKKTSVKCDVTYAVLKACLPVLGSDRLREKDSRERGWESHMDRQVSERIGDVLNGDGEEREKLQGGSFRAALLQYVSENYKTKPDYPWTGDPESAVLRHEDNRKWYGLVMEVERKKLGLSGEGKVCALNVKTRDQMFHDMLVRQAGYFPGYHMNKEKWITILLDGTVPFGEVCGMLDASYETTASKKVKQKIRQPKEWVIPANPKYYDVEQAFEQEEEIDWKQGSGVRTGDTVFLYVAAPVSAILYQCRVTETDIPCRYQDENLTITAMMKLKLLKRYSPEQFPFRVLKSEYGIFAIRGPRGIPASLSAALGKAYAAHTPSISD